MTYIGPKINLQNITASTPEASDTLNTPSTEMNTLLITLGPGDTVTLGSTAGSDLLDFSTMQFISTPAGAPPAEPPKAEAPGKTDELKKPKQPPQAFTLPWTKLGQTDNKNLPKIDSVWPDKDAIIPWVQDPKDPNHYTYVDPETKIVYDKKVSRDNDNPEFSSGAITYSITHPDGSKINIETTKDGEVTFADHSPTSPVLKKIKNQKQLEALKKLTDLDGWEVSPNDAGTFTNGKSKIHISPDGTVLYYPDADEGSFTEIDKNGKVTKPRPKPSPYKYNPDYGQNPYSQGESPFSAGRYGQNGYGQPLPYKPPTPPPNPNK